MRVSTAAIAASLAGLAAGKKCINATVPVTISARTGVFNIQVPSDDLEATTFAQNSTRQGGNFTAEALVGYATTAGTYNISTQFCTPDNDNSTNPTVQVLTHGIGFDKTYWDSPYNNFNYSYVNVATDTYKYCTLSYDRLGIGNSSHGEPLNEIQAPLEIAALAQLTMMLRKGTFPGVKTAFKKVTHVGHSFGSAQTYALVNAFPTISDGIVLTGFSMNSTFVPYFAAGNNFVLARTNQPFRFGNLSLTSPASVNGLAALGLTDYIAGLSTALPGLNYPDGYLTNANAGANQYLFFLPGFFDVGALYAGEATKQPVTVGELLSLGSLPMTNAFTGPVLVFTGSGDLPYCGGDCLATGNPALASIPAAVKKSFPSLSEANFSAYIQPNTGHGLNFHYNQTGSYAVINEFLTGKGLASSSSSSSSY